MVCELRERATKRQTNGCAAMTKLTETERKDIKVAEAAASARHSPAVKALGMVSELADQPQLNTICAATLIIGLGSGNRTLTRAGLRMLAAQLLATRLKGFIKHRVDRSRPSVVANGGEYERHPGNDHASEMNSFPSGHTSGAVAVARAFAREYPRHRVAAYAAAAGVGMIQVPRGKHYPSDVVGGLLIGLTADLAVTLAGKSFATGWQKLVRL
jgi:membrane-associated phospholipid phosphatase